MTTRGIHPDLLDELEAAPAEPATSPKPPPRRRGQRASEQPTETPPPGDAEVTPPPSDASAEDSGEPVLSPEPPASPEWLEQLRASADPKEMLALLTKNLPREDLSRDDVLAGLIGDLGNKRARQMLEDQQRQAVERQKAEAFDRGDLYALGQYAATDLQAQRQALEAQTQVALNPYMQAITAFQSTLPEAVQKDVQGRTYAPGGTPAEGFSAYLQAVHESALRHGLEDEVRKREPALRKVELSSTVGSEQSPELDGGPAQAYREITDAQVAAMTLEEYDRYFDDKGRPRPGVRVRLERGIDIRQQQR